MDTVGVSKQFDKEARTADASFDSTEDVWVGGDVLIEPSIEEHVADCGAHGDKVETEEGEIIISEISNWKLYNKLDFKPPGFKGKVQIFSQVKNVER